MVFFKQYLLTFTCIVILVQVMPASATTDEELSRNGCKAILLCCGFEDTNEAIDGIKKVKYLDLIFYLMNGNADTENQNLMKYLGTYSATKEITAVFEKIIAIFVKNTGTYITDDKKKAAVTDAVDEKKDEEEAALFEKIIAIFAAVYNEKKAYGAVIEEIIEKNTGTAVTDDEKKAADEKKATDEKKVYSDILNKEAAENNLAIKDFIERIATNLSIRYTQFYQFEKNIETVKNGSKAPVTFFCQTYMNSSNEEFKKLFTFSYIDTVLDIKNK